MTRIANVSRKTSETDITIKMNLDGNGIYNISTGINFFNHINIRISIYFNYLIICFNIIKLF